jgi:hypothetical protein
MNQIMETKILVQNMPVMMIVMQITIAGMKVNLPGTGKAGKRNVNIRGTGTVMIKMPVMMIMK